MLKQGLASMRFTLFLSSPWEISMLKLRNNSDYFPEAFGFGKHASLGIQKLFNKIKTI